MNKQINLVLLLYKLRHEKWPIATAIHSLRYTKDCLGGTTPFSCSRLPVPVLSERFFFMTFSLEVLMCHVVCKGSMATTAFSFLKKVRR